MEILDIDFGYLFENLAYHIEQAPLLYVLGFFIFFLILWSQCRRSRKQKRHRRFIRAADRALKRLDEALNTENPGAVQFTILRRVHHFTFEEMVLTALARKGLKIERSKQYTGDGGCDGKFWLNGSLCYIQSKRYGKHINASDVEDFADLCMRNRVKGIFCHTGKTGDKAKQSVTSSIEIISGSRLLDLFLKDEYSFRIE